MKAIVVRQPWATLIALGVKTIETRPAPPNGPMRPDGVRGLPGLAVERGERVAVVAGASISGLGRSRRRGGRGTRTALGPAWEVEHDISGLLLRGESLAWPYRLPLGAVVCTVGVADALPIIDGGAVMRPKDTDRWLAQSWGRVGQPLAVVTRGPTVVDHRPTDQLPLGDFTPGRWGWMLTDPRPCDPVPCKGRQGVFALPDEVLV